MPLLTWLDKTTDVGKVMSHLTDLEVFKVRYRTRQEGEENMTVPLRLQPDVWEIYPNANPKVSVQSAMSLSRRCIICSVLTRLSSFGIPCSSATTNITSILSPFRG